MDVAEDLSQGLHSVFLGTRGLASTIRGQASLTLLVGQASIPNSRRSSAVCGGSTSNRGQTPTLRAQALTHFIVGKRTFFYQVTHQAQKYAPGPTRPCPRRPSRMACSAHGLERPMLVKGSRLTSCTSAVPHETGTLSGYNRSGSWPPPAVRECWMLAVFRQAPDTFRGRP